MTWLICLLKMLQDFIYFSIFYVRVCFDYMHTFKPSACGGHKKVSVPLKLELKMGLSHDLCAEN